MTTPPTRPRAVPIALAVLATVVLGVVVAPASVGRGRGTAEAQAAPYTVTVTPSANLTDGRQIAITIRTTPTQPIYSAQAQVCRAGVDYQPGGELPNPDFRKGGANCPEFPVTSSAGTQVVSNKTLQFAPTPEGETMFLRVGVGTVTWTDVVSGEPRDLTCGPDAPCVLVTQLYTGATGQAPVWTPVVVPLTYAINDPLVSCGGANAAALRGFTTDAMSDAWVNWTLDSCGTRGPAGAWTTMGFGSDEEGVKRVAASELDIAYSAAGASAGFTEGVETPRPLVAVPVALGASVLGIGNGWIDGAGRKRPYGPTALTVDEVTAFVAGGVNAVPPFTEAMYARNPELQSPGLFFNGDNKVTSFSESGALPWVSSRYFFNARPNIWRSPDLSLLGPDSNQPRGIHDSLAVASPTFTYSLTFFTGRPSLARALGSLPAEGGGLWVLSDWTTAEIYDLRSVSIETTPGVFVPPTAESVQAAVPGMDVLDDGLRAPSATSTQGYPLTYVMYAFVPAEPLADEANVCRTASQDLLATWLAYVTGEGQNVLPAGLTPLTPELQAEAAAKIAEVGATPSATPCTASGETPPPTTPPGTAPPGSSATAAGSSGIGGSGTGTASSGLRAASSVGGSVATGAAAVAADAAVAEAELSSSTDIPGFGGTSAPGWLLATLALVGLVVLTGIAARLTSSAAAPVAPLDDGSFGGPGG